MSDKPQASRDAYFALPDLTVVTLAGRDAGAFAQAQFMSDVAALQDGQWHWSGWLTPKGRVVAVFAVVRRSAEAFDLALLDAPADVFAASLQRFVFRSKVAITVAADWSASGSLRAPARAQGPQADLDREGLELELDMGTASQPRTLRLACGSGAEVDGDALAHWRGLDMAHGLPRLPVDQQDTWTPQQLSLERLRAFSVRKGCYPGQEIVARTHFLGKARRGLVGLQGAAQALPGDDVHQDGRTIGRLVCVAPDIQLAVLPLERPATPLSVAGIEISQVELLDGLQR